MARLARSQDRVAALTPFVAELRSKGGHSTIKALDLLGLSAATYYRHKTTKEPRATPVPHKEREQPATLQEAEKTGIRDLLCLQENASLSISKVFYKVFDQGIHIASQRSWYRVAKEAKLSGDRRRQATHPPKKIPQLIAHCPNMVWSWDISKLKGLRTRQYFDLYLIMDIYSRFIVGWRVEHTEVSALAAEMLSRAVANEGQAPQYLHSDNGASMKSKIMADALAARGIASSFSRPKVSNDNPFSEALFRTFKYEIDYPKGFPTLEAAQDYVAAFVARYNNSHQHEGIAGHTPATVHYGRVAEVDAIRQASLDATYAAHPKRFAKRPLTKQIASYVAINDPKQRTPQTINLSQTG